MRWSITGASTSWGLSNPPSGMPTHASFLYSRNVANVLGLMGPEGTLVPDWDDEIVTGMCVLRDWRAGGARRGGAARRNGIPVIATILQAAPRPSPPPLRRRAGRPRGIIGYLTIFVLAAFVGVEVVSKVPSILHTPLMSGSNAIHGIVLVGALDPSWARRTGTAQVDVGLPRRAPRHPQHRRGLRRHRPHARDVQGQAG